MGSLDLERNQKNFLYKPLINPNFYFLTDLALNYDLQDTILITQIFKDFYPVIDDWYKKPVVYKDFWKRLNVLHFKQFQSTINHSNIVEMLSHVKDKCKTLSEFGIFLNSITMPDYEIPYDNPSVFDDNFRLFLDYYIPMVEGENEIPLEWIQPNIKEVCVSLNLKVKNMSLALQMAVTGKSAGTSGWHAMSWIGPRSTVKRLTRAYFYNLENYNL